MTRKPFPSEMQDRFIVRLPDGMRDRLKNEAESNNRSMNAEIVARLQASLDVTDQATLVLEEKGVLSLQMAYMTDRILEIEEMVRTRGFTPKPFDAEGTIKRTPEEMVAMANEILADYLGNDPAAMSEADRETIKRLTAIRDRYLARVEDKDT